MPAPCANATDLENGLASGISVPNEATYHSADGTFTTVGRLPLWVSKTPFSTVANNTVAYRAFFAKESHVYAAVMVRAGELIKPTGSSQMQQDGAIVFTYLGHRLLLNQQAFESLRTAIKY